MSDPYDIAIVLGTRFGKNWQLRQDLTDLLDKVIAMYHSGDVRKIIVSGKWTIWYDWLGIVPPTTEAKVMKDYLVTNGVNARHVIQEKRSKDTIGNLYYSWKILPKSKEKYNKVAIVCATQRLERVRFIVDFLFDARQDVHYISVNAPNDVASSLGVEKTIFDDQKAQLSEIKRGIEHSGGSLYRLPYYRKQAKAVRSGERKSELKD